jgi:hypothetical protein
MTDLPTPPHRRGFLRGLAAGATALGAHGAASAQEPQPPPADPVAAEVEARLAIVVARHGARLDEAARETIRGRIAGQVRRASRLRQQPLDNGEGPFPVFIPYRGPLVPDAAGQEGGAHE